MPPAARSASPCTPPPGAPRSNALPPQTPNQPWSTDLIRPLTSLAVSKVALTALAPCLTGPALAKPALERSMMSKIPPTRSPTMFAS